MRPTSVSGKPGRGQAPTAHAVDEEARLSLTTTLEVAPAGVLACAPPDLLAHGHRVAAVGSRSPESEGSPTEFTVPRAHGSYEELLADPDVDVVYVATPHIMHAANALAAVGNGKHALVEKAFTVNAGQARTVVETARDQGLLVMEAMRTRFLPHMAFLRSVVASGRIGTVRSLSFAHDILGVPIEITGRATLKATGVDASVTTILRHADDAVSTSFSSSETRGPNRAVVLGTDGRIDIDPVWYAPAVVTVRDAEGAVLERFYSPVSGRGMQYEAAEVERLLAAGETASPLMTPEDSVAVMATMDEIRHAIGVRYPDE